ncbi:MAG: DNA-directed RNA polymerase subunit beta [Elusimicrobiota bacterium]|jgi:DNA-directed RNA polymerase subunit beta|nr:DNA-directed RNA polymerase subunit beta [Elusimicrobiota bacterium]
MNKVNFGKIIAPIDPPLLLKMQKDSFEEFLQRDIAPEKRKVKGLEAAFRDIFPLVNSDGSLTLEYVSYYFDHPRYSVEECVIRDATYALPLRVKLRLIYKNEEGKVKDFPEQEVYFGDMPLMTDTATFIINGAERVVVSQIHRSPGIIFEEDEERRVTVLGKPLFFASIIPYRGAWVEFELDQNGIIYVRIDRKRKVFATTFLRALGIKTDEEILNLFKETKEVSLDIPASSLANEYLADDIYNKDTGEIIVDAGKELKEEVIKKLQTNGYEKVSVLKDISILMTLKKDPIKSQKEAVNQIYKVLKTQEFVVQERAQEFLDELLFKSTKRYDLTVGRYKILKKLKPFYEFYADNFGMSVPAENKRTLMLEDIVVTLKYFLMLYNGESEFKHRDDSVKITLDDIDHLGNRRVRSVGELLENQIRIGLVQMARFTREHMNNQDKENVTPRSIVNITQFTAQIRKFFGTSQLSQFMDQINPLAELTHKRRLSALGPGGLNRKRAGFEVRDVHHTHYARICPIETPEGANIGLLTSLSTFARINQYGLIETPYKKVIDGKATDEIEYLTADKEDSYFVAQANTPLDKDGTILSDSVHGRRGDSFEFQSPNKVSYMDISPMQVISVSAGLVPFLEHDDSNRALMGCSMQKQGVPLLVTEAPLVSTGIEEKIARDSGVVIVAKSDGEVVSVSSDEITVYNSDKEIEVYKLKKYLRSNQDTCIDQKPLVKLGDDVKKGQVIADGPATKDGQLALGQNLLVAFMPWDGYNFEDAMLLSEQLIKDDKFTSVHIREFETEARETKGRPEEITKDIPNVGSEDLLNLDESGVIKVGSMVQRGDILVGKTTPKNEQQSTPEERLLRVLFGKRAEEVQDASLRVPPGTSGKVIAVRTFVRLEKLSDKDKGKRQEELKMSYEAARAQLRRDKKETLAVAQKSAVPKIESLYAARENSLKQNYDLEKERIKKGDDLPVSVNKIVKVYIASKMKVQVGDKLAGRHGNKGIVARILPVEDMPRLPDGTPIDCVLSPLAIPSRMNVGQLLEVMLGWAAKELDTQMITPVFDGASEEQIKEYVRKAKDKIVSDKRKVFELRGLEGKELENALDRFIDECIPTDDCRITLYDGRTGEPFLEKVTVGVMYVMKLNHLVEDKMHARSTGPYSLITRQPLGGKAQFGGQRFGEMEVWAIEGYGASHILQEFLTVKSDDVDGRVQMYDSIVRGEDISEPGVPESFKVLVNELKALGLNIELLNNAADKQNQDKQEKIKGVKTK